MGIFLGLLLGISLVNTAILLAILWAYRNYLSRNKNKEHSLELREFLSDMQTNGYSFVRINPDNVFYRGRKE